MVEACMNKHSHNTEKNDDFDNLIIWLMLSYILEINFKYKVAYINKKNDEYLKNF